MPRQRCIHVSGGQYHAVLRGNHRQAIFSHCDDYLCFEENVARALERYGADLLAYCWMTNHVHLNPVRARMVADPRDYQWSSHRAYLGAPCPSWLRIAPVLEVLGRPADTARAAYRRFMNAAPGDAEREAIAPDAGGGPARRHESGWRSSTAFASIMRPNCAPSARIASSS